MEYLSGSVLYTLVFLFRWGYMYTYYGKENHAAVQVDNSWWCLYNGDGVDIEADHSHHVQ